jgi:hypothetical protein
METTMQTTQLHDDNYFRVTFDDDTRVISIDWKDATGSMTDDDFKSQLELFAGLVERKRAQGILVDVARFRHQHANGPEVQKWRIRNISPRYSAAGVRRFAFLMPPAAQIPPMMNQSSPGEGFLTRAFNSADQAMSWLTKTD